LVSLKYSDKRKTTNGGKNIAILVKESLKSPTYGTYVTYVKMPPNINPRSKITINIKYKFFDLLIILKNNTIVKITT
jgi:hypothetical protein